MLHETAYTTSKPPRVSSLDIFRGLNVALMIFVNELSGIRGLPWWTHHAPAAADVMTYVDMVFPCFLIIIGMSLPLALNARVRRGDGIPQLIFYIILRSVALLLLGLILENGPRADGAWMHGLGGNGWSLLALLGAFLMWMDYPRAGHAKRRKVYLILRLAGFLLIVVLTALYRRTGQSDNARAWLTFEYPEILGSIGYSYLVAGFCYLSTRKLLWAPLAWFGAFITLNILSAAQVVNTKHPWWLWPVQNGSKPALIFAGILIATVFFLEPRCNTFARKAAPTLAFGVVACSAARMLHPLGISKIRATPAWVLYNVAACCLLYSILYFVCDVRKHITWAKPFKGAGSNTLLTYLLPDVFYFALGVIEMRVWSGHFDQGGPGVLSAVAFTILMLAVSNLLTHYRIRLQL